MANKQNVISLKTTLAVVFFSLSAVVLLISGIVQIAAYYQTQQEAIASKQNLIAGDVTGQVTNFIQMKLAVMDAIGEVSDVAAGSKAELTQVIEGLLGIQTDFRHVALLDASGKFVAGSSRFSRTMFAQFISSLPADLMVQIKTDKHYISQVYFDEMINEPRIIMAVAGQGPLGDLHNVLVGEINLKFMWNLMVTLTVGESGYAYVVDRSGMMIAYKDLLRVLKKENMSGIQAVADFLGNKPVAAGSIRTYRGLMGTEVAGRYVPLKTPDWAVVIELPIAEAFREVWRNLIITAGSTLVMAILSGLIGLYLAQRLASPLIKLTAAASRIAEGDTDLQATVSGSKEIVTLAHTFNSMTTQLRNRVEAYRLMNGMLSEIIAKAKEMIIKVNSASTEIEAASQEQTGAANEQASGIREVSATLEELTVTAKQITKNVGELVFSSEDVINMLKENEQQLLNTVTQLEEAGVISKNNAEQIEALGKRSVIINEMVDIIKEIANKTNILSINASIEAARSGQTKSGFSVVAAEIRLLSRETIESAKKAEAAAKDIRDFLNSIIISSGNEAAKVIGSGQTTKVVFDNTEKIVARINNNYTFTQKIDISIKQQEQGSVQAAETMQQMAESARRSAKNAQAMLATAKDIVALGQELDETVMKFIPENRR